MRTLRAALVATAVAAALAVPALTVVAASSDATPVAGAADTPWGP